jgi:hypothetical protein
MKKASLVMPLAVTLVACGGGGGGNGMTMTMPTTHNMQAGIASMVTQGLSSSVTLSGSVTVSGVTQSFTGSGTYSLGPGMSAMFNGMSAMAQTTTISGTVTVAGTSKSYSASDTSYYAPSSDAFLGQQSSVQQSSGQQNSSEYDVAQAPFDYPTSVQSGSTGVLGTIMRYTDSTMSVPLGTAQVSYAVQEPMGTSSSLQVTITTVISDTSSHVTETDTLVFDLSSSNAVTFVSASAQGASGSLTVTAQGG